MHPEWTRTTCPYCGVGCGVLVKSNADGTAEVKGDPDHPANFGRLCSKGSALGETLSTEGRLLRPSIDGVEATWDQALDLIASRFSETIATHGADSVAMYVSGQLLTEDYYVANKLMKGFIGSANIDTNSRLCMASSVAGHKRAFGADTVPGTYSDLEQADLVVLVGSNLAWCHPVLFQRLSAAREQRGTKVVVIDPRRTVTCEIADLHLAIAPGTDVALFNGLFSALGYAGAFDRDYVGLHTSGFDAAAAAASRMEVDQISKTTGLPSWQIYDFYKLFAETEKVVTVYSQGVNQSSAGTDKVNAIINCHLATGRIGQPGMGPFSVTGQPNAMGGRETGGLANMLAAHMDLDNTAHHAIVSKFWETGKLPTVPGLKAVDLFRAVSDGRIKALWIMATNPVDSFPEADAVRAALEACPFVVVSDVVADTGTTACADVLLPATAWGEKDGTVTNSERRISRQRAFIEPPGEAKPDWWQISEVARRLGYGDAFDYQNPAQIFSEYAALTGAANGGSRDLDISAYADTDAATYDSLKPFQWPQSRGEAAQETRFFANGGYFTPDRRARFVATPYRPPASQTGRAWPLVLNTGRIRDQWHTMTRTSRTPRLMSHISEPFVEIHPDDAAAAGLRAATIAEVTSCHGAILARVAVSEHQRRGSVFVPMHWNAQHASKARVDALVEANVDAVSGQPELKFTPVAIKPFAARWYGFAVTRNRLPTDAFDYTAVAPVRNGYRAEIAHAADPRDWAEIAGRILNSSSRSDLQLLAYQDCARGAYSYVAFEEACCAGMLFVSCEPVAVSRAWAVEHFGELIAPESRLRLLAGRPGPDTPDRGAIVCSCFETGSNEIVSAIQSGRCRTVGDVGTYLQAGTNCGSCRSEIMRLIGKTKSGGPVVHA